MTYEFRNGNKTLGGLTAPQFAAELERIREQNSGRLAPRDVLDAARPEDSPLHAAFQWDDSKAAEEYRLQQARTIIKIVVMKSEGSDTPVPVYVHVNVNKEPYYQNITIAVNDHSEWDSALTEARREVADASRALDALLRVAPKKQQKPISRALTNVQAAVTTLQSIPA